MSGFLSLALASAAAPLPPIVLRAEVAAPPEQVWQALTTEAGARSFFAPDAWIEARIDGAYELYFMPENPPGLRGGEGNRILAIEPARRLLVSWNAPPQFGPLRGQHTVFEYELEPLPGGRTLVTGTQSGWGQGAEWAKVRDYFVRAWPIVLGDLQYRFKRGPVDWSRAPIGAAYFRPAD
jgi:uncharacterized protein YndB with AHSA1/START domain